MAKIVGCGSGTALRVKRELADKDVDARLVQAANLLREETYFA
jgi:hypothetical protein